MLRDLAFRRTRLVPKSSSIAILARTYSSSSVLDVMPDYWRLAPAIAARGAGRGQKDFVQAACRRRGDIDVLVEVVSRCAAVSATPAFSILDPNNRPCRSRIISALPNQDSLPPRRITRACFPPSRGTRTHPSVVRATDAPSMTARNTLRPALDGFSTRIS